MRVVPPESGLARAAARPRAAKMQFYYLFHLRSCAAATAGCCGSAYSGGSRTVFVPSLLDLFVNLFTSVFVYGLPIFLLVAFVLGSAFCASSNVPTFVYRAAAAPVGAAALPVLDPDRGIRVKLFVKGQGYHRTDKFVPHGLTARQVLDRVCAADADVELFYPAKGRKYSDDEVVAAPVVIVHMRLRLRGGAPKKRRKTTSTEKPSTEERSTQTETEAMDSDSGSEDDGAECCCIVRKEGVCKACPKKAHYRVSIKQMEKTINDKTRSKRKGKLFFDRTKVDDDDAYRVCEEHLVAAAKAHMQQVALDKGASGGFDKRNFLQNILKATDTHENKTARPVQPGKRARVSTDTKATPEKKDLLTELFEKMRPYCKPGTFVYNILMTIFRHVLIMNKVYEYGRNVWHGNPEGEDVLRFWIVYGTIVGTSAIDLLRGGAIAKRAKRFLPGVPEIFDGGLQNLPGVPGPRQVRYYSATPYPLKDIVRVSALMVDAALEALGGPEGLVLGVTFDCVHGESRLEVVRDIDGEFVVLGPASPDGLKGAARGKDDFDDDKALGGKDIAEKLMTVVLHVFNGEHVDREVCIAVVPLNEETGKIIANVFLELRRLCFEKGSWLIFAGGDGASPNRDAWKIIKGKSSGDKTPLFEKVKKAEELPF